MKENWKKAKFGDVAQVVTGNTPSTSKSEYFGGEIPFVTPAELDKNLPITKSKTTLTVLGAEQSRLLPSETVMVCCIGSLGKIGIAGTILVTNQQINSLIFDKTKVFPRYGYHYCRTLKHYLESTAPSTTLPIINKSRFSALEIPLPPLGEQKRIAEVLDCADALREKRRRALQKLDTLLQSVFFEMFGDPVKNPKGYSLIEISKLTSANDKINYGVVQPGDEQPDGLPLIRVGDFVSGKVNLKSIKRISPLIESNYKRSRLKGNEILISCVGSIGNVAIADESLKGFNIARAVARVPLDNSKVNRVFLCEQLRTQTVQNYFTIETRTVSQPTLNISHIEATKVFVPPVELQNAFADSANKIECIRAKIINSQNAAENLFQSLQQRAFKGELFENELTAKCGGADGLRIAAENVWKQDSLFREV